MSEEPRPAAPWGSPPGAPGPPPGPTAGPPGPSWRAPGPSGGWAAPAPPPPIGPRAWRSLHGLGIALQALFWSIFGLALFDFVLRARERNYLEAFLDGRRQLIDFADARDAANVVLYLSSLVAIAAAVCFIVWLWRAAKNLEALGRTGPTLGAGWAIGAWFIPVANLLLPYFVVRDAWRGSDPACPPGDPGWKRRRVSGLLGVWWLAYVASSVAAVTARSQSTADKTVLGSTAAFRSQSNWLLAATLLTALAAVLAGFVVRDLTARFAASAPAAGSVGAPPGGPWTTGAPPPWSPPGPPAAPGPTWPPPAPPGAPPPGPGSPPPWSPPPGRPPR